MRDEDIYRVQWAQIVKCIRKAIQHWTDIHFFLWSIWIGKILWPRPIVESDNIFALQGKKIANNFPFQEFFLVIRITRWLAKVSAVPNRPDEQVENAVEINRMS